MCIPADGPWKDASRRSLLAVGVADMLSSARPEDCTPTGVSLPLHGRHSHRSTSVCVVSSLQAQDVHSSLYSSLRADASCVTRLLHNVMKLVNVNKGDPVWKAYSRSVAAPP